MANIIENVIIARDEATPKLRAVRAEVARMSGALSGMPKQVAPGLAPQLGTIAGQIRQVTGQLSTLAPAATGAFGPMQSLLNLSGTGLGPIALGIGGVAASLTVMVTAAKAAVVEVGKLADKAEQLENLSQSTGVSVTALQGLQMAIADAGIPVESLAVAMRTLNRSIAESDPALKVLQISSKDTLTALLQLADAFQRTADGPNKTALAVQLLGRSGEQLIPILNQGSGALRGAMQTAQDLGVALSGETVAALLATDSAMDELSNRVRGLKNEMALLAAPALTNAVGKLNELLALLNSLPSAFLGVENSIKNLAAQLAPWGKYLVALESVVSAIDKANKALKAGAGQPAVGEPRLYGGMLAAHGPGAVAAKPELPPPPPSKTTPSEREQMLTRLQELLRLTRSEAELAYADLKRLDDSAAALALQEKLSKARGVPVEAIRKAAELPWEPSTVQRRGLEAGDLDAQARAGLSEAMAKRAESRRGVPDFSDVARAFKTTLDEMNAYSQVTTDLIYGSFYALQGALTSVFQGIYGNLVGIPGQVMTMSKAIVSIVNSMVNEILAGLARLAASRLFLLLINLLGLGLPTKALKEAANVPWETISRRGLSAGGLIRGPGSETSDSVPVRLSRGEFVVRASAVRQPGVLQHLEAINRGSVRSGFSAPRVDSAGQGMTFNERSGRARSGGNTFVIQALSARDAILSLTQPGGELRRAMDDVVMQGAY